MMNRAQQCWPGGVVIDLETGRIQDVPFVLPPYDDSAALQGTTIVDLDQMAVRVIGASVGGDDAN